MTLLAVIVDLVDVHNEIKAITRDMDSFYKEHQKFNGSYGKEYTLLQQRRAELLDTLSDMLESETIAEKYTSILEYIGEC